MTTDTPIYRLVKCPKCRLVLPELANLPLYKCGGCGTVLQAKRRKRAAKSTKSKLRETDVAQINSLDQDPEDKESSSSSCKASCASSGDNDNGQLGSVNSSNEEQNDDFLEQNYLKGCSFSGNCDSEQLGRLNLSNEDQNDDSLEQNDQKDCSFSGDSDSEELGGVNLTNDKNNGSLEQNDQKDSDLSGACDNERLRGGDLSNEDQNDGSLEKNDQKSFGLSRACDNEQLRGGDLSNEDQNDDSLEQNDQKDCSLSGDSFSEELGGVNLSNDQNDVSLEQNDQKDIGLSGACDNEQLRVEDLSNEDQIDGSFEKNDLKGFGLSGPCDNEQVRVGDLSNEHQNDGYLEQNDQEHFVLSRACDTEQLRGGDSSNEDYSHEMHHNESYGRNIQHNGVPEEVCSPVDLSSRQNEELSPLEESNTGVDVNDKNSPIAREKSDVESNDECNSTIKRSSTENPVAINGMRHVVTAQGTARESISSDVLVALPTEQMEHSQEGIAYAFDRVRSTNDTLETADFINRSSELSGNLIDLSKSPTTRSYHAYYDGCTSSLDGIDDQSPNHYRNPFDRHRHPLKNSYKVPPNRDVPEERPRRNKFLANGDAEMQHRARKFSSSLSDKMHKWNLDELQKPMGFVYAGGNSERYEYPSWLPSYPRGSPIGFESGSTSNQLHGSSSKQLHDEFHWDPSIHLRNKHEYTEQEKRKLLRMVNELQDQLYRSYNLNEETQGRDFAGIAQENHMDDQSFYNLNYPIFPGRFRQESNWSRQNKFLHKPFSGEATYGRHRMDSCVCCRPADWQNSSQLPPFGPFHNKGSCRIHPSQSFHPSYSSCPSSTQQHLDSKFPLHSRETKSDDQRHKDHRVKRYLREKQYSGKKHLRPIAGAAPFITCHRCLKQLQLPGDFLLFGRRCHRLKCGACSEVIKFSVKNGTHLVPYLPNFKDPPPSEIDEYNDATDGRNLASASHPSKSSKVGWVSYSDDYSFSKSCSRGVHPAAFTPMLPVPGNAADRKIPGDSLKNKQEKKKSFSKESHNKNKNPVGGYMSAEPSASTSKARRISSEIEELPPRSASPLHRLMGYSSPSQVIKGSGSGPAGSRRS